MKNLLEYPTADSRSWSPFRCRICCICLIWPMDFWPVQLTMLQPHVVHCIACIQMQHLYVALVIENTSNWYLLKPKNGKNPFGFITVTRSPPACELWRTFVESYDAPKVCIILHYIVGDTVLQAYAGHCPSEKPSPTFEQQPHPLIEPCRFTASVSPINCSTSVHCPCSCHLMPWCIFSSMSWEVNKSPEFPQLFGLSPLGPYISSFFFSIFFFGLFALLAQFFSNSSTFFTIHSHFGIISLHSPLGNLSLLLFWSLGSFGSISSKFFNLLFNS